MEERLPKAHSGASLEGKVDDLAVLLSAGMTKEFVRQFRQIAANASDDGMEELVEMVNKRLKTNSRRRQLRLVVSQKNDVTVLDGSRFWGNSFSIARETFAIS
jgi:hypothetical protein